MCYEENAPGLTVALLAEGVDRNLLLLLSGLRLDVALLAEGVDRNTVAFTSPAKFTSSPSSRRAWIEIAIRRFKSLIAIRRPPRGGRG